MSSGWHHCQHWLETLRSVNEWNQYNIGLCDFCSNLSAQCHTVWLNDLHLLLNVARLGGCLVQEGSSNSVGTPSSYSGSNTPTTYSCVTDCTGGQYEVHVIGMYDAVVFQNNVNVQMTVCGHSSKRLVLVLISQRELQWVVDVPRGVFIHRILVVSHRNHTQLLCNCWWMNDFSSAEFLLHRQD